MTDDLFDEYFAAPREERAARLDGAAISDPSSFSHTEVELGELLVDILGHTPNDAARHTRWLLVKCKRDYDGLRRLITKLRIEGELDWVQLRGRNVYSLRGWLAEEYTKEQQAEERRLALNTTEGRRARYVTDGVQS